MGQNISNDNLLNNIRGKHISLLYTQLIETVLTFYMLLGVVVLEK